ncbi:MAG: four helix bundle protein [Anaerolineae bacterium]|nr:four helix bundle protein [Phycisphaerae bacterium]
MRQDELKARTKSFAMRVMKMISVLPKSIEAKAVANQLVRSGTAVGANYRATCRARSRAEFIAKIGIVEEEADESAFWLELIIESKLLTPTRVQPLLNEANELVAIMAASRISAGRNKSAFGNRQSAI